MSLVLTVQRAGVSEGKQGGLSELLRSSIPELTGKHHIGAQRDARTHDSEIKCPMLNRLMQLVLAVQQGRVSEGKQGGLLFPAPVTLGNRGARTARGFADHLEGFLACC